MAAFRACWLMSVPSCPFRPVRSVMSVPPDWQSISTLPCVSVASIRPLTLPSARRPSRGGGLDLGLPRHSYLTVPPRKTQRGRGTLTPPLPPAWPTIGYHPTPREGGSTECPEGTNHVFFGAFRPFALILRVRSARKNLHKEEFDLKFFCSGRGLRGSSMGAGGGR